MTPLGLTIIVVGLAALLASRRLLYRLLIFSVPFSGTSVVNIGSGENAAGIQPWMYFGALVVLAEFLGWLLNPRRRVPLSLIKRGALVATFVLILSASLLMPEYINGKLEITSPSLTDPFSEPLRFGERNITSFIYVAFGATLALCIARRNLCDAEADLTEKSYLSAAMLVCFLGIAEFISHLLHFPSPTLLFRNSASEGARGYLGFLTEGVTRVSSVAVEPSILAQYLMTALPLTLAPSLGLKYIFSKSADRFAFCLVLVVLILTTSSVAYISLAAAPLLLLPAIYGMGIGTRKIVFRLLLGAAAFLLLLSGFYFVFPFVKTVLNSVLFQKAISYSALDRLKTISLAWGYFKQYPLLGVGWGSVTSHDLIVMILANSGILGLIAFSLLSIAIIWPTLRRRDASEVTKRSRAMWLLSWLFLLFASGISEFPFVFGHLWIVMGMGIAASLDCYRRPAPLNSEAS